MTSLSEERVQMYDQIVQLTEEVEKLRADIRRLRRENQWLRNRRNRAVELLTGDPGPDPEMVDAPVIEDESVSRRQFSREGPAGSYPEDPQDQSIPDAGGGR